MPQPSSTRQVSSTGLSRRCCLRASPDRPTRLRLAVPKWTRRQGEETPLGPSSGEETPISQDGMSYRVRSLPSSLFHPSNRALPSDCVARVENLVLKVATVDKQLGSQRQLQVPDLLAALAIVAHLSSLYLRVADIGGHNLGWGIEPLAIGAEANHILQERALRHRPYVPLILFDAGRWRESPAISFPGQRLLRACWV